MRKGTSGFTVVELIIVIVVIAVIATISFVAYSGVQTRARNAKVISGVDTYKKVLLNYAAKNNGFPAINNACLGADYPSNQCSISSTTSYSTNSTLDSLLAPYLGGVKPVLSTKPLTVNASTGLQRLGALYLYSSPTVVHILYYLEGLNQKCMDGDEATNAIQATQCRLRISEIQ